MEWSLGVEWSEIWCEIWREFWGGICSKILSDFFLVGSCSHLVVSLSRKS